MPAMMSSVFKYGPPQTPVIDLTIDPIGVVDLTSFDDSPPNSPRALIPASEPPRKRQRLQENGSFQSPSRNLLACLRAQAAPYINACLAELPSDRVKIDELGIKVLLKVSSNTNLQLEFKERKGFLSSSSEEHLAELVRRLISKLASEPEFQLNPNSNPAISPASRIPNLSPSTPTANPLPVSTLALLRPSPATVTATATPVSLVSTPLVTSTRLSNHRPSQKHRALPTTDRTRVRTRWKTRKEHTSKPSLATARHKSINASMQLEKWPYITTDEREAIIRGTSKLLRLSEAATAAIAEGPIPFHIDFTAEEIEAVRQKVREMSGKKPRSKGNADTFKELGKTLRHHPEFLTVIGPELELKGDLAKRDRVAIRNLLDELVDRHKKPAQQPKVLTLEMDEFSKQTEARLSSQVPSLLFAREIDGNRGFGRMRRLVNFTNQFKKAHEDDMHVRAEWVNCAGDIMTIAWTSSSNFICGTTTHSDSHNQQYNKDGNLLCYSSQSKELKAYPDHRVPRPVVDKGDNSTEAMRESQSPWLYSSVVASDYDKINDRAYTASFDKTVKVWRVSDDGGNMTVLGTWQHTGIVQFVAASKHESGMVATGADATSQAVRVYHVKDDCVSESPYQAYSNLRAWNEGDEQNNATQKWTYYPATMQWGLSKGVQHLLLVGYSPRSLSGDDNDIPDEKKNTGEICVWNCLTGERIKVLTASTQNVFEVAWHPTQPVFIVATSPAGPAIESKDMTQIRVFEPRRQPDGEDVFGERQCLDCPAKDINELTIKQIDRHSSYVTAACTDGNVYVWDTARGDKPVHALEHKAPIDKEDEDVGVKFTAWGTSADRFYTGGSDGKVKIWNVRNLERPFVRELMEAPGCVTSGAFSPDFSKLVIGDASGRVMLLSFDEADEPATKFVMPAMPPGLRLRNSRPVRRPLAFRPHDEPPPPPGLDVLESGVARSKHYLATGQLTRHPDPTVGVLQGPLYSELDLYRNEFHFNSDPTQPLLAKVEEAQQENQKMFKRSPRVPRIQSPVGLGSDELQCRHSQNMTRDLDLGLLEDYVKLDLELEKVNLDDPIDSMGWDFEYEEE